MILSEVVTIPAQVFYPVLVSLLSFGAYFVFTVNARVKALEVQWEQYKLDRQEEAEQRRRTEEKIDVIVEKLNDMDKKLSGKADKKYR